MVDIYPGPTEPTPPGGYAVLAVAAAILLIVAGAAGLAVRVFAEIEAPETAALLTTYSLAALGIGAAIAVGTRVAVRVFR